MTIWIRFTPNGERQFAELKIPYRMHNNLVHLILSWKKESLTAHQRIF